tara:strand:- start:502 stop:705 length:204 start_codon:yes stop_codon:yes gene_type:complete
MNLPIYTFTRVSLSVLIASIAGMIFLGFFWFFMLTVQDIYCEGFKYESEFLCEDKVEEDDYLEGLED